MSWEYGRLATEICELDNLVGRTFPGLDYYARRLGGEPGDQPAAVREVA